MTSMVWREKMDDCDLSGRIINLRRANLQGAKLFQANLQDAILKYVNLSGAGFLSVFNRDSTDFSDSWCWETAFPRHFSDGLEIDVFPAGHRDAYERSNHRGWPSEHFNWAPIGTFVGTGGFAGEVYSGRGSVRLDPGSLARLASGAAPGGGSHGSSLVKLGMKTHCEGSG